MPRGVGGWVGGWVWSPGALGTDSAARAAMCGCVKCCECVETRQTWGGASKSSAGLLPTWRWSATGCVCGVVGVVLGVGANRQQVVEPPAAVIIKGRKVVEWIHSAAPICFQDRQSVAVWGQEVGTTRTILTFCRGDGVLAGNHCLRERAARCSSSWCLYVWWAAPPFVQGVYIQTVYRTGD